MLHPVAQILTLSSLAANFVTPAKVVLAVRASTFPPPGLPLRAEHTRLRAQRPASWLGVPPWANARDAPRQPDTTSGLGLRTCDRHNESIIIRSRRLFH